MANFSQQTFEPGGDKAGHHLDKTDRRLLAMLRANGRMSYRELGEAVGLSAAAAFQRVRKLEQGGVVTGYHAAVLPDAIGRGLVAYLHLEGQHESAIERLLVTWHRNGDATECHRLSSGRYVVKLRLKDVETLETFLHSMSATGTRTSAEIGIRTLFDDTTVPETGQGS